MSDKGYVFLEHTADAYIKAWGKTFEDAFAQSGLAFTDVITDLKYVTPKIEKKIVVTGEDIYFLLYNWLDELLYTFSVEQLIFSKIHVEKIEHMNSYYKLSAICYGEVFDINKHPPEVEVKGVTFNLMKIEEKNNQIVLYFVLDI
ncbi:MAG: archease [Candidatus Odinarchaeota archaeon]|nr:archease [Candidatus Odinarchaeota archaeon]